MKKIPTSADILQRAVWKLIVFITLGFEIVIIGASGHQLYERVVINSQRIARKLVKTEIDSEFDWQHWRMNSNLDTENVYFLEVDNLRHAKPQRFYTENAKQLANKPPWHLFKSFWYRERFGILYRTVTTKNGIRYVLWHRMYEQTTILIRIIWVTLAAMILIMALSPLYVKRLAKRLTHPLTELTQGVQAASERGDDDGWQLAVPEQPAEIVSLTQNFNQLLKKLYNHQAEQQLFIMNAAHELRTPIAAIRSHVQLLERHGQDHPEIIPKSIRYIDSESRQMQDLVNSLLKLTRADVSNLTLSKISISQTVAELVEQMQPKIAQPLKSRIEPDCWAIANQDAVTQIIHNLIANAAKYSPADQPIQVTVEQQSNQIICRIIDEGPGILPQDLPHVFERFYRSSEVRSQIPGTGLGLAIAAQLSQLIQGKLTVHNHQPHGAVFELRLLQTLKKASAD